MLTLQFFGSFRFCSVLSLLLLIYLFCSVFTCVATNILNNKLLKDEAIYMVVEEAVSVNKRKEMEIKLMLNWPLGR